jgi:CheY-like chemotaxis protein
MQEGGPYAVVISDMRMPGMSGSEFLARARRQAPDTVRMLLTGYTDLGAAAAAVNEGNIFRFLTKPCAKEDLVAAIGAGVEQHALIRAEKELLENTLMGSIKVLADFLSASNPEAFARSRRIANIVRHVASRFSFEARWRLEAAATLSQLGCVTLASDVIQRAFVGLKLSPEDQARFNTHPGAAMRMLTGIPRLEPVAWMIGQQLVVEIPTEIAEVPASALKETLLGAKILKLAVAFNDLLMRPLSHAEAVLHLRDRAHEFDRSLIDSLDGFAPESGSLELRRLPVARLTTGMILDQEIRNKQGVLMVTKGQEITRAVLTKLENFALAGMIEREVMVLVPA